MAFWGNDEKKWDEQYDKWLERIQALLNRGEEIPDNPNYDPKVFDQIYDANISISTDLTHIVQEVQQFKMPASKTADRDRLIEYLFETEHMYNGKAMAAMMNEV